MASGYGGAISFNNGTIAELHNSIFDRNLDVTGNTFTAQVLVVAGLANLHDNAFVDPACPAIVEIRPPDGTGTNLCLDPLDPLFVDHDGIDGMVGTEDDDLNLKEASPCIDAACNNAVPYDALDLDFTGDVDELLPWDVEGGERFLDDPCSADYLGCEHPDFPDLSVIDMGALEAPPCSDDCPADFNKDGVLNVFDFLSFQSAFGDGDMRADIDGNGVLNVFDFLKFLTLFGDGC